MDGALLTGRHFSYMQIERLGVTGPAQSSHALPASYDLRSAVPNYPNPLQLVAHAKSQAN